MPSSTTHAGIRPIRGNPEAIVWPKGTSDGIRAHLCEALNGAWHVSSDELGELVAFVGRLQAATDEGPVLLFIALDREGFPSVEYLARALRAKGLRAFGVYVKHGEDARGTFDDCFSCRGSLGALAELVLRMPVLPIYLQAHARRSFLSRFIHALRSEFRVFHEVYDWMDAFIDPAHEDVFAAEKVFTHSEIALMRESEDYIRTRTAGFIYKDGGDPMDVILRKATVPSVQVMPCPPRSWQRRPSGPPRLPWKLAHAGQLRGTATSRAFRDLSVAPLYQDFAHQGCEVAVFPSVMPGRPVYEEFFGEYLTLAERESRICVREHLPVRELIDALHGRFHYGILLYRFGDDVIVGKRHLQSALASKLFVYWAAGLPVLVSEELAYMASLVEETGAGLVVSQKELPRLAEKLDRADYAALQARVGAAQDSFYVERFLPRVLELMRGQSGIGPNAPF